MDIPRKEISETLNIDKIDLKVYYFIQTIELEKFSFDILKIFLIDNSLILKPEYLFYLLGKYETINEYSLLNNLQIVKAFWYLKYWNNWQKEYKDSFSQYKAKLNQEEIFELKESIYKELYIQKSWIDISKNVDLNINMRLNSEIETMIG